MKLTNFAQRCTCICQGISSAFNTNVKKKYPNYQIINLIFEIFAL